MLLLFSTIILIGGIGALYWGSSIDQLTNPNGISVSETDVPSDSDIDDDMDKQASSEAYLVFQTVDITDEGEEDWGNDDTQTYTFYKFNVNASNPNNPDPFARVEHGPTFTGALTTYVFGQHLLMHRFASDGVYDSELGSADVSEERDGLLDVDGNIVELDEENWTRLRSENGLYEIDHTFAYNSDGSGTVTVSALVTEKQEFVEFTIDDRNPLGYPDPFLVENTGERLYVRQVCGCEASFSEIWELNLETGDIIALHDLVDIQTWNQTALDPENRRLLVVTTTREPSDNGPYEELSGPSNVQVLDIVSGGIQILLEDDEAWYGPKIDPMGNDRYLLHKWNEQRSVYLMDFEDTEITESKHLTDGYVLDWVGNWILVQDAQNLAMKIVNIETREEIPINLPGERVEYIGSIERE